MSVHFEALLLTVAMSVPALAQLEQPSHYVLSAGLVAQALSKNGTPTTGDEVSLPATVVATEPSPVLDIVAVEALPGARGTEPRSRVKLACRLPGACLPFYAFVTIAQPVPGSPKSALSMTKPDILMRAGASAILILDDQRAHIQLPVVCLENGMAGKWIRVTSPDHKQMYRGEVVSASLLRGTF